MKRLGRVLLAVAALGLGLFWGTGPASAHQDGCHRFHSCPADDGSYVCGDLGYACSAPAAPDPAAAAARSTPAAPSQAATPAPAPARAPAPAAAPPAPAPAAPAPAAAEEQRTNLPRTGIPVEVLLGVVQVSLFLAGVVLIAGDPWWRKRPA